MERMNLTCIRCPRGCALTVELEGKEVLSVTGNACKRGDTYARNEAVNPVRVVTSTVPVDGSATQRMVSVKTAGDVPKAKIFDCVVALKDVRAKAPVHIGDVILADVAGTGVDIIATKDA